MLDKDALFTPRLYTYECTDPDMCDDSFRANHCLSNGKYCPWTSEGNIPKRV